MIKLYSPNIEGLVKRESLTYITVPTEDPDIDANLTGVGEDKEGDIHDSISLLKFTPGIDS